MADVDETKKLSPEERLRKLREIAKKDEEEIKKARELMKQTEVELEEEEKQKKQIPIPQLRSVDVDTLFGKGTEEDKIFRTKHYKDSEAQTIEEDIAPALEDTIAQERERQQLTTEAEEVQRTQYQVEAIRYEAVSNTYDRVREIGESLYSTDVSKEERQQLMDELGSIVTAAVKKMDDVKDGSYLASKEASDQLIASYSAAKQLKDRYKG